MELTAASVIGSLSAAVSSSIESKSPVMLLISGVSILSPCGNVSKMLYAHKGMCDRLSHVCYIWYQTVWCCSFVFPSETSHSYCIGVWFHSNSLKSTKLSYFIVFVSQYFHCIQRFHNLVTKARVNWTSYIST